MRSEGCWVEIHCCSSQENTKNTKNQKQNGGGGGGGGKARDVIVGLQLKFDWLVLSLPLSLWFSHSLWIHLSVTALLLLGVGHVGLSSGPELTVHRCVWSAVIGGGGGEGSH